MSDSIIILNLCESLGEDWIQSFESFNAKVVSKGDSSDPISYIVCDSSYDLKSLDEFKIIENKIKLIVLGAVEDRTEFFKFNGCLNVESDWVSLKYSKQILDNLFNKSGSIHLSEMFDEACSEVESIKVEERKDIGFYVDQIGNTAFKNDFDLIKIRTFSMFALTYLSYAEDSNITYFPVEVEMGKVFDSYCVQISCNSSALYSEYFEQSLNAKGDSPLKVSLLEMIKYSDSLNINYISDGNKLLISAFWSKDSATLNKSAFSITNISSYKYASKDSENIADEYALTKNADNENIEKRMPEKILSPEEEKGSTGGNADGSYLDSLDDDDVSQTVSGSEGEDDSAVSVSGGAEEDDTVVNISGSSDEDNSFSKKLLAENKENPEEDKSLFDTYEDIEKEIEGWNKSKLEAISEHQDEIRKAETQSEVEDIIRQAIGEKISIPAEELQELIDQVKDAIDKGEVFKAPEKDITEEVTESKDEDQEVSNEDSSEIKKLQAEIDKRNKIISDLRKLIDSMKVELESSIQLQKFETNEIQEGEEPNVVIEKYRNQIKNLCKEVSKREVDIEKLKMAKAEEAGHSDEPETHLKSTDHNEELNELRDKVKQLEGIHEVDTTRVKNMNENIEKYKKQLQLVDDVKREVVRKDSQINSLHSEIRDLKARNMGHGGDGDKAEKAQAVQTGSGGQETIQRLASKLNDAQIELKDKTKKLKELEQKNKFLNGQLLSAANAKDKGAGAKGSSGKEKELAQKVKTMNARISHVEDLARRFKEGFEKKKLEGVKLATENRKLKFRVAELEQKDKKSA